MKEKEKIGQEPQSSTLFDLDQSQATSIKMETPSEYRRHRDQNGSCHQIGKDAKENELNGKKNGIRSIRSSKNAVRKRNLAKMSKQCSFRKMKYPNIKFTWITHYKNMEINQ